jgi:hypothetical protein
MKNVNYMIEKLNSKKFNKNRTYSSREISSIIGTTSSQLVQSGALKDALNVHPEWQNEYGRVWRYVGPQQPNLFNHQKSNPQVRTRTKKKEISLLWGLFKYNY